ncbi:MAG: CHAD domain-containing protein [Deltaproteobacteria bacterium]|nr:CHAD domain-containing protein [Deltaproteobacteria bacterium]
MTTGDGSGDRLGLARWMRAVVVERENVERRFDADAVHDLRVAIRRCRSIAQGLREIDPHPAWRAMNRDGRRLFAALGAMRDTHVLMDWVTRLGEGDDPVTALAIARLEAHEAELRLELEKPLRRFDVDAWERFAEVLVPRTEMLAPDGPVYLNLALRRFEEAHALHRLALKNRGKTAWHQLRIGIKRLRYTVENFLPDLHDEWGDDLKTLQDLLGEVHDLDVLWDMLGTLGAIFRTDTRARWRDAITRERRARIDAYRALMVGRDSRWRAWRSRLPSGVELSESALATLDAWAAFRDECHARARHASRLALELLGALRDATGDSRFADESTTRTLPAASRVYRVGARDDRDGRRVTARSARLIRKLSPPVGFDTDAMERIARVVECVDAPFVPIPGEDDHLVPAASAVLRLARALAAGLDGGVRVRSVEIRNGYVEIDVTGLPGKETVGEEIARARYGLERLLGRPVFVPQTVARPKPGARSVRRDSATARVSPDSADDTPRRGKTARRARSR